MIVNLAKYFDSLLVNFKKKYIKSDNDETLPIMFVPTDHLPSVTMVVIVMNCMASEYL